MLFSRSFAEVLTSYVQRSLYTPGQLSRLTGIPKESIVNWVDGKVRKPRDWRALLKLASALHLNETEANELLESAGHPRLRSLLLAATTIEDQLLFQHWTVVGGGGGSVTLSNQGLGPYEQLALLPLDSIPAPSGLPVGSRIPFGTNPLFVGRHEELQHLAYLLKGRRAQDACQITITITGSGGIGKTQLVAEAVHRYGRFFAGGVFWLSFAQADGIAAEIAACGGPAHLNLHPAFDSLPLETRVGLVRAAWQGFVPCLLVFDNCEDPSLLDQWRPITGSSRVLVTSRRREWERVRGVATMPLNVLSADDSITLLRQYRPDLPEDTQDLRELVAEMGRLPLALQLAGAYLARYRLASTVSDYLRELRQTGVLRHPSLQDGGYSPTGHAQHVARTFDISYDQLKHADSVDGLALQLLSRAAWLAPSELIPRELLITTLPADEELTSKRVVEDAIARLLALGLVETNESGALRIHHLLSLFVRDRTQDLDPRQDVERTICVVTEQYCDDGNVAAISLINQHLRFLVNISEDRKDEQAADLCYALGYYQWHIADYVGAQHCLERALAIREKKTEFRPLRIAGILNLLALVYQLQCKFENAQPLFERALRTWEQGLGPADLLAATEHNNLGYLLLLRGKFHEARTHFEHALCLYKQHLGLRHKQTSRVLNNLGYLHLKRGDYALAQRCLRVVLRIRRKTLPALHPATALTLNNLGEACYERGAYKEALAYHEEACRLRTQLYGDEHNATAESLYNLGKVLHALGEKREARRKLEYARDTNTRVVGVQHRETAFVLNALGCLYVDEGAFDDAKRCFEQALAFWDTVEEGRHPEAVGPLKNLGRLLERRGCLREAYGYLHRATAICREMFDESQHETRTVGRLLDEVRMQLSQEP